MFGINEVKRDKGIFTSKWILKKTRNETFLATCSNSDNRISPVNQF